MGSGKSKVSGKITVVKPVKQVETNENIELSQEDKVKKFHEVMNRVQEEETKCEKDPISRQQCIEKVNKWAHNQLPQNGGSINNYTAELNIDGQVRSFSIIQKGSGIYEAHEIQSGGNINDASKYIRFKYH